MIVLGIESSCDETSIAVLQDDKVISNLIASQHFHNQYGGVIPELSSRAHLQQVIPLLKSTLNETKLDLDDIDVICATAGPGLIGALLVGLTFGKSLALTLKKPFVPVNHIEGHIFSGFLMDKKPEYPYLCSVVSGGHTLLLLVKSEFEIIKLGTTIDDAIGEAFDKVSKMIGLGYPGGPLIQKYSSFGDNKKYSFPIGKAKNKYDFSFSGLKTSVLRTIQAEDKSVLDNIQFQRNIAASFELAAVKAITKRIELALNEFDVNSISLVGGVAANNLLRNQVVEIGKRMNKTVVIPKLEYCGDNAAMIALRGLHYHSAGQTFTLSSNAYPSLDFKNFEESNF